MSIFTKVWDWLRAEFKHIVVDIAKVAVTVTEQIKTVVGSPATAVVASILDQLETHGIAAEVLGTIKNSIVKVLAFELAIQLPSGPITGDEFIEWEQKVFAALGLHADRSAIYTKISTAIVRDYQAFTQDGSSVSFAEGVIIVQDAFKAYKEATA